ncbi:MAG TPA: xylulokinase, partial [Anaerovoracaceae bacterium]|nr:xylulokinase [Anaerovoracaceae bacterium]
MTLLMGIDLGTSGIKVAVFNENGDTLAVSSKDYIFDVPRMGYAEQDPEVWWNATVHAVREVLTVVNAKEIAAIGLSGQMHGLVALDQGRHVVRKAILHCDQRSVDQVSYIKNTMKESFSKITYNPPFPGFQLISLLWVKDNEPENYRKIRYVICPKDYIRFRLCGEIGVEITDASATLAYDIEKQDWAWDMIEKLGIDGSVFPKEVHMPCDVAGTVTRDSASLLGLSNKTKVVYGGGDQPMQLLGTGVYTPGKLTITIGTSGQIVAMTDAPVYNPALNTHTFNSAIPNKWFCMGAVLHSGSTLNWFKRTFMPDKSYKQMDQMANEVDICSDGLLFFPCFAGERTPYIDSTTRGIFLGMSYLHNTSHFIRAIMEGVSFGVRSNIEVLEGLNCSMDTIIASGGAAKSSVWLQMQADIYGRELHLTETSEQTVTGAAIVASVGCGLYQNIEEGCRHMARLKKAVVEPDLRRHEIYSEFYSNVYKKIYESNKDIFRSLYDFQGESTVKDRL